MNVQIIYSSLTGCTEKVAEALYQGLHAEKKSLHNLRDGIPEITGDILLLGYFGVSGQPCDEMKAFLPSVKGKAVGIFCTLGYYADSAHARDTVEAGLKLVKDRNQVIGSFVCNGAISPALKGELLLPHTPTEQKEIRWEITDSHPTRAELSLAVERFNERLHLISRCRELGIPFTSVL